MKLVAQCVLFCVHVLLANRLWPMDSADNQPANVIINNWNQFHQVSAMNKTDVDLWSE